MPYIIVSGCVLVALLIMRASLGRPEPLPGLEVAHAQISGERQINADVFDWSLRHGKTLLVLAEGIGAGTRGRTAALSVADSITRAFDLRGLSENTTYFFQQAFRGANETVLFYIPDGNAGANVLCAVIAGNTLNYALAGNCRIAVFRRGELIPLSDGQTLDILARKAFKRNKLRRDDARTVYDERKVYNFVGKDDFRALEMPDMPVALKQGDCIVLMTDGVYDFCPAQDIERILRSRKSCQKQAEEVMDLLTHGHYPRQDNATIVLARVNRLV
jgi:serine/threonine protein phosphatase PrpC